MTVLLRQRERTGSTVRRPSATLNTMPSACTTSITSKTRALTSTTLSNMVAQRDSSSADGSGAEKDMIGAIL